jgi:large subunit ribosomal protein L15
MRLHDIVPVPGSTKRRKRLGRGESSGKGKTSGKGHKGQKARAGGAVRLGFEGGQMPMLRRLPKRGFTNGRFKKDILGLNVSVLEKSFEAGETVNEESLRAKGLVKGVWDGLKILGNGDLTKSLTVQIDAVSTGAKEKIEKAGGKVVSEA